MNSILVNEEKVNDSIINFETMTELGLTSKTFNFNTMEYDEIERYLQQKPNNEQLRKYYMVKELIVNKDIKEEHFILLKKNIDLDKAKKKYDNDIKEYNNEKEELDNKKKYQEKLKKKYQEEMEEKYKKENKEYKEKVDLLNEKNDFYNEQVKLYMRDIELLRLKTQELSKKKKNVDINETNYNMLKEKLYKINEEINKKKEELNNINNVKNIDIKKKRFKKIVSLDELINFNIKNDNEILNYYKKGNIKQEDEDKIKRRYINKFYQKTDYKKILNLQQPFLNAYLVDVYHEILKENN